MKLQTVLRNKGFTIFEIIIVLVIISSFLLIGSFFDQETAKQKSIDQEKLLLISVLQKIRSRAMNNIEESGHGLHIDDNNYILFKKIPYNKFELTNENISRNSNIKITASVNLLNNNEVEIIFNQLSGEPINTGEIKLDDGVKQKYINIINGGLIDW